MSVHIIHRVWKSVKDGAKGLMVYSHLVCEWRFSSVTNVRAEKGLCVLREVTRGWS
jgi:hypothetical protein